MYLNLLQNLQNYRSLEVQQTTGSLEKKSIWEVDKEETDGQKIIKMIVARIPSRLIQIKKRRI